jgi:hypothetical protein
MTKHAKVLIAVPSHSFWEADFGMSLLSLVVASATPPEGYESLSIAIQNSKGSILPALRQELVEKAQEMDATHILFLDSDMTFPAWTLHKLLEDDKLVVAANCVTKSIPANPTARAYDGTQSGKAISHLDYLEEDAEELVKVWRVGTGVMLINMKVFKRIDAPFFPIVHEPVSGKIVGEDWGFCGRCEAKAIDIYIDTLLSNHIGHIGRMEYNAGMISTIPVVN